MNLVSERVVPLRAAGWVAFALVSSLIILSACVGRGGRDQSQTWLAATAPASDTSAPAPGLPCLLDPGWSSAGARAAIDWRNREVYVIDGQQGRKVVLPPERSGGDYAYTAPSLSPDGVFLVVGASLRQQDGERQAGLWRYDLRSGERTLVFPSDNGRTNAVDDPAFSPDGRLLAFTYVRVTWLEHGHEDRFEVWVVGQDGSAARKVADGRQPRWSSDGRYLAYDPQSSPGPSLGQAVLAADQFRTASVGLLVECGHDASSG